MATPPAPHHLLALPSELLIRIFQVIPTFQDAVQFRKTCHALNDIWLNHTTIIIAGLAWNQFECYPYARQLLAKSGSGHSVPLDKKELNETDLAKLMETAKTIDRFIISIEQDMVPKLKLDHIPEARRRKMFKGASSHPPHLTQTERLRIIRAFYQMWGLRRVNETHPLQVVSALTPRQLFYLNGLQNWARVKNISWQRAWSPYPAYEATQSALKTLFSEEHKCGVPVEQMADGFEELTQRLVIWDHWQDPLNRIICWGEKWEQGAKEEEARAKAKEHLWDWEAGDENCIFKD